MSDPAEGTKYNTKSLSPVSPRPVHYQSTANIPVLENQMDPIFNDTATHEEQAKLPGFEEPEKIEVHDTLDPPVPEVVKTLQNDTVDVEINGQPETTTPQVVAASGNQTLNADGAAQTTNENSSQNVAGVQNGETDSVDHSAFVSTTPATDHVASKTLPTTDANLNESAAHNDGDPTSALPPSPLTSLPAGVSLPARPPAQVALPLPSTSTVPSATASHDPASDLPVPETASYAPLANAAPPPPLTAGAPGTLLAKPNETTMPSMQSRARKSGLGAETLGPKEDENIKWGPDTQQAYDEFLNAEREYVLIGRWEDFPVGSRLFVGNLSSELVTKRDLFHVFHKYGKLAQLSIKSSFGFVQFLNPDDARRALQNEQDVSVRGRNIHLEASNPQRNNKNVAVSRENRSRRSPSPVRRRSRADDSHRYNERGSRPDIPSSVRNKSYEHYRPTRSRSPSRRNLWSPNGYRQRSPPMQPPYKAPETLNQPIPRRTGLAIPELQILVKGPVDRMFIDYVKAIAAKKLRVDEMFLGERLDMQEVMQRQGMEGVLGVMVLSPVQMQTLQNFSVTIMDYSLGNGKVGFEEYTYKSLEICIALVVQAQQKRIRQVEALRRQTALSPFPSATPDAHTRTVPPQQYPTRETYSGPGVADSNAQQPNIAGMDPASLQMLLAKMQGTPSMPPTPQQPPYTPASNYGTYKPNQPPAPQIPPNPQSRPDIPAQYGLPGAGYGGYRQPTPGQPMYQPQQPQQQSPAPNAAEINAIMAQLGNYKG